MTKKEIELIEKLIDMKSALSFAKNDLNIDMCIEIQKGINQIKKELEGLE